MAARADRAQWIILAGFAGLAVAVGGLAGLNPQLAVAAALGTAFVLLAFTNLAAGIAAFTFLSFLEPIGGGSVASANKLAGVVLALAWIAYLVDRDEPEADFLKEHAAAATLLAAFLAWVVISLLWAESTPSVLAAFGRYLLNIVLVLIVYTAIRTKKEVTLVMAAFLAGAAVAGLYDLISSGGSVDYSGRLGGGALDPNELASVLVAGVAISAGVAATYRRSPGLRLLALGGGVFCLFEILLTVSRGGLVALSVSLLFAIAFGGRWRAALSVVAALLAVAVFYYFVALAPPSAKERITQATTGEVRTEDGRATIWEIGRRMVAANPVIGVGAGNFRNNAGHYLLQPGAIRQSDQILLETPQVAHNTYLEVLAELGIIGLALFGAFIVFAVYSALAAARRFRRVRDGPGEALARALAVGLVGTLVADTFISQEFNKQLWLLMALGPVFLSLSPPPEADPAR